MQPVEFQHIKGEIVSSGMMLEYVYIQSFPNVFSFNIKKDLLNDLTCSKVLFIVSIFFIMNKITRSLCMLNLNQYNVNFGLNIVLVSIQHA